MKIAFVYDAVYPYVKGGAEKRIYELSLCMAKRGHEVHIFGMKYWSGSAVIKKDGICYHGVCRPKELYVNGRRSIFQAIYFSFFLFVPLLREKASVIDCQAFPYFPLIPSWLVSKITGCFLVVTWHEVWGNYWYEYLGALGIFGKFIERFAVHLTKNPVAVSDSTAGKLRSLGIKVHIPIVTNGINLDEVKKINPAKESSNIIFVGRLIQEKNVGHLLWSLVLIREKLPDIKAIIIGDGPEREVLENLAYELELTGNVIFTGFLSHHNEIIAAMKASQVFVLPSTREGFGIVAIEAMACGLPVVTVRAPQNAACDLIQEGKNGYIADLSPSSLAENIIKTLSEREEMKESIDEIIKTYGWDEIIDNLIQIYLKGDD